jgi:hypothetical protein
MDLYKGKKYNTTIDGVKKKLEKYGVAIIPSILNENECNKMKEGMWNYLEQITKNFEIPINRNNDKTWGELSKLWVKHSMLIQQWKIGHSQFNWDLRQNKKIINVFSKIWNKKPEELLVSFDGASVHMPPEITKKGWFRGNTWLHSDQSFTRNNFECVQSWVTANEVNIGDATLAFYEKSNRYHEEFKNKFNITDKGDWFALKDQLYKNFYLKKGCKLQYIKCPAGSLVLWDSRTIHCGQEAMKDRKKPNIRFVSYLCYTPRDFATENMLKKKINAFENMRTTSHWPHKPKLFPLKPRTYGQELAPIAEIQPPQINDLGKKLIGY